MDTIATQALTLVGVVLGTVGSLLVSRTTERRTWQRTAEGQWDQRRMETYAEYGLALKRKVLVLVRLAASRGLLVRFRHASGESLEPDLMAAELERSALWEQVLLVGDPATVAAVRDCNTAVREMEQLVQSDVLEQPQWDGAVAAYVAARRVFHSAARSSLRTPGARYPTMRLGPGEALVVLALVPQLGRSMPVVSMVAAARRDVRGGEAARRQHEA